MTQYTAEQVKEHNSESSAWIIVHGKVYDVTKFANEHPGGKKVLLKAAGTDASKQFDAFHARSVLTKYGPGLLIGEVGEKETKKAVRISADEGPFGEQLPFGDPSWYTMDSPYYDESHRQVRAVMREFVEKEIMPYCHEWDEAKQVPRQLYIKCAEKGILAAVAGTHSDTYMGPTVADIPPEKFDPFHEFIVCDELSRCGSGGVLWALIGGLGIGLPPVLLFGSKQLQQKVVPDCLSGKKCICLAITEPQAGSDVANLTTTAVESEDGQHYIVNGEKKWITNSVWADYFTVAVRTGDNGMNGISLLLIERSMPGVKTRQMHCSGVWSSGTGYITFEDVKVPKENIIGQENEGFKCIMYNFNHERVGIAIQATRFSRVCYEESLKYAHKRKTFGKRLIDHPVIRNKLANMAREIEASHAWMENLIYQSKVMPKDEQMYKLGGPIALLKAHSTAVFDMCAREAAQIFGGLSYTRGGAGEKVERLYREVRAYAIPGGSSEIMLDLGIRQSVKIAQMSGAKL